jgi:hypothetical protein
MTLLTRSLALLLIVAKPAAAQFAWPYHDPSLLDKLYTNDYQHIGNDNLSRQDLMAVIQAFGLSDDPNLKCPLGDDSLAGAAKLVSYMSFLSTDYRTGEYPSREAREVAFVSVLYPDPPYAYINDPNLRAMAREIEARGCGNERVRTIGRNLAKLLDDRMAGRSLPLATANVAPRPPPRVPGTGVPAPASALGITLLEPIDFYHLDPQRTYKGRVQRDVASDGQVVLPAGTEVQVKAVQAGPIFINQINVDITAVSAIVNGTKLTLTTEPQRMSAVLIDGRPKYEYPAGSEIWFTTVQAAQ